MQMAFEFHLSFPKMRENKLDDSFSVLAELFCRFFVFFFLLVERIYWNSAATYEKKG